jgi:DNA-binding PadR family transcriptional regulator
MTASPRPRSPLWMIVLSLACEEPMHPYRMQALIKQRGKDHVANVAQRNSVYQTIDALMRAGLIAVRETARDENRPERTVYEATERGRDILLEWLRTALSTPAPDFPAALSTLDPRLKPELRSLLEARVRALQTRLPALEKAWPGLPRIFLLEDEYLAAMVRAEIAWLGGVIDDLRAGRLKFPSAAEIRRIAVHMGPPSEQALRAPKEESGRAGSSRRKPNSPARG